MKLFTLSVAALVLLSGLAFIYSKYASTQTPSTQKSKTMSTTPNSAFTQTPLHLAAEAGDHQECQTLIASGADVNGFDDSGWSPLVRAVQGNHIETARFLLNSGADIHYTYLREDTPEERVKVKKETETLSEQLNLATSLEETFKDLPKDIIDELSSEETINEMNQSMVDLHFEPNSEHAIEHCTSLEMLKMLVEEFAADINYVAGDGYWPLSSFAESDDLMAVKWLLENGANPNNTSTGETAIFKAIQNDNLEMVRLFTKHGAKLDVEDVDGWSVLFPCESIVMAQYLIKNGASPTSLDQVGFPCWHWVDDQSTKDFLKQEALKRGLKKWTTSD